MRRRVQGDIRGARGRRSRGRGRRGRRGGRGRDYNCCVGHCNDEGLGSVVMSAKTCQLQARLLRGILPEEVGKGFGG